VPLCFLHLWVLQLETSLTDAHTPGKDRYYLA
jgi:hypothetical protein